MERSNVKGINWATIETVIYIGRRREMTDILWGDNCFVL